MARGQDLLISIEDSLRERRMGTAVRLQYDPNLPPDVLTILVDELELGADDLYPSEGFTAFADLVQLYSAVDLPRLKDRPLAPHPVPAFERRRTSGARSATATSSSIIRTTRSTSSRASSRRRPPIRGCWRST